jgi:antirestriction protein
VEEGITMPRVYVGTYRKYNEGSLKGKWLDLEDYSDEEDFYKACAELHEDEEDPEFMFQDWDGVPSKFESESSIEDGLWDYLNLDDDDKELLEAYWEVTYDSSTIEQAREAYQGKYKSEAEFAECYTEEVYGEVPPHLVVDWQATWKYSFAYDYFSVEVSDGFLFFSR